MYTEASYLGPRKKATLQLSVPGSKSASCLVFYYHMYSVYGRYIGVLNVYNGNVRIFSKSKDQGNGWKKVAATLHFSDVVSVMNIIS